MRTLETERLELRPMDERDEELYCRIYTDAELMRYVGEPLTRKAAVAGFGKVCRFNREAEFRYRCWVMIERDSSSNIGVVALMGNRERAEFGVMILTGWQGRGVALEVVMCLVDYAFEKCGVEEAFTRHLPDNRAGAAVMRKLGFEPTKDVGVTSWCGWRQSRSQWLATRVMSTEPDRLVRRLPRVAVKVDPVGSAFSQV